MARVMPWSHLTSFLPFCSYFGDTGLVGSRQAMTIVAMTYCDLLSISDVDLKHLLRYFPEFEKYILDAAQLRQSGGLNNAFPLSFW